MSAVVLDEAAKVKEPRASFDAELCEATRHAMYAEAVATNAVSCATAVEEKIARLEGQLQEAIRASHWSEAAEARSQLLWLVDGVRALERWFKEVWESMGLGEVKLPPRCDLPQGELYLLPRAAAAPARGVLAPS